MSLGFSHLVYRLFCYVRSQDIQVALSVRSWPRWPRCLGRASTISSLKQSCVGGEGSTVLFLFRTKCEALGHQAVSTTCFMQGLGVTEGARRGPSPQHWLEPRSRLLGTRSGCGTCLDGGKGEEPSPLCRPPSHLSFLALWPPCLKGAVPGGEDRVTRQGPHCPQEERVWWGLNTHRGAPGR